MDIAITSSQWVDVKQARLFSILLSQFNGWFKYDDQPVNNGAERVNVSVCFESVTDFDAFCKAFDYFSTPIVEKNSWRVTLKNFLSRHF